MADKGEVDSPGFRYTVSKNPFNPGIVWRFALQPEENTEVTGTVGSVKIDTSGVTDTEDRG